MWQAIKGSLAREPRREFLGLFGMSPRPVAAPPTALWWSVMGLRIVVSSVLSSSSFHRSLSSSSITIFFFFPPRCTLCTCSFFFPLSPLRPQPPYDSSETPRPVQWPHAGYDPAQSVRNAAMQAGVDSERHLAGLGDGSGQQGTLKQRETQPFVINTGQVRVLGLTPTRPVGWKGERWLLWVPLLVCLLAVAMLLLLLSLLAMSRFACAVIIGV